MKIKFPDEIRIGAEKVKLKARGDISYSKFETGTKEPFIMVGLGSAQPRRIFERFLHELMEYILTVQDLRYGSMHDEKIFVMTHKEFTCFCEEVARVLLDILENQEKGREKQK